MFSRVSYLNVHAIGHRNIFFCWGGDFSFNKYKWVKILCFVKRSSLFHFLQNPTGDPVQVWPVWGWLPHPHLERTISPLHLEILFRYYTSPFPPVPDASLHWIFKKAPQNSQSRLIHTKKGPGKNAIVHGPHQQQGEGNMKWNLLHVSHVVSF